MNKMTCSRLSILTLLAGLLCGAPVLAQAGGTWQYRWQKGQTLDYRVEQVTEVSETTSNGRVETKSRLNLVKRWFVADVDARNVATLQLTLASLKHEQTRPNGDVMLFDSMNPGKSEPELREQMSQYVGKTVASLKIDGSGQVLEVMQGVASRYGAEPPFIVVLPRQALSPGQAWQRNFHVVLDPPLGTGEKYLAKQIYKVNGIDKGRANLALTTEIDNQPESPADRVPLLQKLPQGQVVFDLQAGRLVSARLNIDKTLENHQGAGSSYRFQSRYSEELISP